MNGCSRGEKARRKTERGRIGDGRGRLGDEEGEKKEMREVKEEKGGGGYLFLPLSSPSGSKT